jgi:hypothetical protein
MPQVQPGVVSRQISQAFPDTMRVILTDTYTDGVSTSTADTFYEFSMNGAYDPYLGTGGGQPYGFDQWSALYRQYRVHKASISVYFRNTSGGLVQVSVIPNFQGNSAIRTYFNPEQLPYCKYKRFPPAPVTTSTGSVVSEMSIEKICGSKRYLYDDDFLGTASSNPSATGLCYWYVLIQDPIMAAMNITGDLIVKLSYDVEFQGRVVQTDS